MTAPALGRAKVTADGTVTPLGVRPAPGGAVTAEDVQEPPKLARILAKAVSDVAGLLARWSPRSIDYEDVPVTVATTTLSFEHGFNGRVRFWDVGSTTNTYPILNASTTATTLVLTVFPDADGTVSIRVEESG